MSTKAIPAGKVCADGGVEVVSASGSVPVCNGTTGFTPFLPAGQSERGMWSTSGQPVSTAFGGEQVRSAISFNIPLEHAPAFHVIPPETPEENDPEGCSGTVANPQAAPGNLCVFVQFAKNVEEPSTGVLAILGSNPEEGTEGAGKSGVQLTTRAAAAGGVTAIGDWVVTAG